MIKKVIGIVVAMAAIAVIVIAALHNDRFTSLVFDAPGAMETAPGGPGISMEEMQVGEEVDPWAAPAREGTSTRTTAPQPADSISRVRSDSASHAVR